MPPRKLPRAHGTAGSLEEARFLERYKAVCQTLSKVHKGCHKCGCNCIKDLADDFHSILTYRRNFRNTPKAAQDRELLWIFAGAESGILSKAEPQPKAEAVTEAVAEHTSPSNSLEVTSETPNSKDAEGAASSTSHQQEMTSHSTTASLFTLPWRQTLRAQWRARRHARKLHPPPVTSHHWYPPLMLRLWIQEQKLLRGGGNISTAGGQTTFQQFQCRAS